MFVFIVLVLIGLAAIPLIRTLRKYPDRSSAEYRRKARNGGIILAGMIIAIILWAILAQILSEVYWFSTLGFTGRYATAIRTKIILFFVGGIFSFVVFYASVSRTVGLFRMPKRGFIAAVGAGIPALISGFWLSGNWELVLRFFNRAASNVTDPVLGQSVSFYLFSLPFYDTLIGWLIFLAVLLIIAWGLITFVFGRAAAESQAGSGEEESGEGSETGTGSLSGLLTGRGGKVLTQGLILAGILFLLLAANNLIAIPRLLSNPRGLIAGPTFTDVKIRMPVFYVSAGLNVLLALLLFLSAANRRLRETLWFGGGAGESREYLPVTQRTFLVPGLFAGVIIVIKLIVPGLVSAFYVNPNELEVERPYIERNMDYTRKAYNIDLDRVSEEQIQPGMRVVPQVTERNEAALDNVRLWDWRALQANLEQQQEIRLYYEFNDVDVDRYTLDDEYTQVMVSAREMEKANLAERSQTWVSEKFKYTHGYGMVMLPAHEVLPEGGPNLIIKNMPAQVGPENIELNRPSVYYGERTVDHVYVNTREPEFHFPAEGENSFISYDGTGGVVLDSPFKELLYAWMFDGHRILFSNNITRESRILYRRHIVDRAKRVAPFLAFDRDPYLILTEDGGMKYILDGYTRASTYPYSFQYTGGIGAFAGANYLRNPVKVTVDAYSGKVKIYVIDDTDPIISTYMNIFPEIFTPEEEMPSDIRAHIRYPEDIFNVQADVFATYHITDPELFYQKEDVWEFATERYRENFQTITPYYIMVQFPEEDTSEFVLMLPYTPKNKNVMNAWIAGRSDGENYGQLKVYTFPKGVEVLGPRQIEARIDQNSEMSRALSLWGQRGSEVIRGNLLAVPLFSNGLLYILYVEPIYLQAEDAALPEIRRVAIADQDRVVWASTFDRAVDLLLGRAEPEGEEPAEEIVAAVKEPEEAPAAEPAPEPAPAGPLPEGRQAINEIERLLNEYRNNTGAGDYAAAGRNLERIEEIISGAMQQ